MVSAIVRSLALGKWSLFGGCLLGRPDLSLHDVVNARAGYAQHEASFLVPGLEERGVFPTEQIQSPRGISDIAVIAWCFHHGHFSLFKLKYVGYLGVFGCRL